MKKITAKILRAWCVLGFWIGLLGAVGAAESDKWGWVILFLLMLATVPALSNKWPELFR